MRTRGLVFIEDGMDIVSEMDMFLLDPNDPSDGWFDGWSLDESFGPLSDMDLEGTDDFSFFVWCEGGCSTIMDDTETRQGMGMREALSTLVLSAKLRENCDNISVYAVVAHI